MPKEAIVGSAAIQGPLWGVQARDWARMQEQTALPLFSEVLDAARVHRGSTMLDAGCGAGLPAWLAAERGATVSGIDASTELVSIARSRLPDADMRVGDLETLPYADAAFDAVVAINALFYAADPPAALREFVRVTRPGGRIVVTTWGPAEKCEFAVVLQAVGRLLPPPPPGVPAGGPFALSEPGLIEAMLEQAGLQVDGRGEAFCPFVYPDVDYYLQAQLSSGVIQRTIEHSGEAAVNTALLDANRDFVNDDGSMRYENVFVWVTGVRQ